MIPYQHIRTYGATDRAWLSALSDLSFITIKDRHYLFTVTQQRGGGVTAYELDELTGLLNRVDTQGFPVGATYHGEPEIAFFDDGDRKYLYLTNLGISEYLAINLADNGELNGYNAIASPNQFRHVTAFGEFETSAGKFLYSAFRDDLSIHITKLEDSGRLTNLSGAKIPLPYPPYPHENASIERLLVAQNGNKQFIAAISGLGDFIAAYEVTDSGQLKAGSLHTGNMGIGYAIPTDAIAMDVLGEPYLILASPGSSSLTVLQLGDDGSLKATDHVPDTLNTRFKNITAIDSVTLDGRNFIFVGGVDDGISIFTLQPGGTLLHIDSIEDLNTTTLQDVTDIEATIHNKKLEVFVSSAKETGITHLRFDPGKIGTTGFTSGRSFVGTKDNDLLVAKAETVKLFGAEGDDILIAGDQGIKLDGGPGADVFVPTGMKGTITIQNFEPGIDRLDFSQFDTAASINDLRMNIVESRAVVRRFDLKVVIHTKDSVPFSKNDLTNAVFPITHYDTPEQEPVFLPRPTAEELLLPYLLGEPPEEKEVVDPLVDPHPISPDPVITPPSPPVGTPPQKPLPPSPNGLGECYEIPELVREKLQAIIANDGQSATARSQISDKNDSHDHDMSVAELDAFIFNTHEDNPPENVREQELHAFADTDEPDPNDSGIVNFEPAPLDFVPDVGSDFML